MTETPQAGGSYRRNNNGSLTPIGTTGPVPAAPEPTATADDNAPASATKKGK